MPKAKATDVLLACVAAFCISLALFNEVIPTSARSRVAVRAKKEDGTWTQVHDSGVSIVQHEDGREIKQRSIVYEKKKTKGTPEEKAARKAAKAAKQAAKKAKKAAKKARQAAKKAKKAARKAAKKAERKAKRAERTAKKKEDLLKLRKEFAEQALSEFKKLQQKEKVAKEKAHSTPADLGQEPLEEADVKPRPAEAAAAQVTPRKAAPIKATTAKIEPPKTVPVKKVPVEYSAQTGKAPIKDNTLTNDAPRKIMSPPTISSSSPRRVTSLRDPTPNKAVGSIWRLPSSGSDTPPPPGFGRVPTGGGGRSLIRGRPRMISSDPANYPRPGSVAPAKTVSAPTSAAWAPKRVADRPTPEAKKAAMGPAPQTCSCRRGPVGTGQCYYYTDFAARLCSVRACAPTYVCVARDTGVTCVRRRIEVRLVLYADGRCRKEPVKGFIYVPYRYAK